MPDAASFHLAMDLLHQAAQMIEAARLLLEARNFPAPEGARATASAAMRLDDVAATFQRSDRGRMNERRDPDPLLPIAILLGGERELVPVSALVKLVNVRLRLAGTACARILLRLMAQPGQMVSIEKLTRAAGIKSSSSKVIKVYICRLRGAFDAKGIAGSAIETGSRSYGLRAGMLPVLLLLLAEGSMAPQHAMNHNETDWTE